MTNMIDKHFVIFYRGNIDDNDNNNSDNKTNNDNNNNNASADNKQEKHDNKGKTRDLKIDGMNVSSNDATYTIVQKNIQKID